MAMSAFLLSLSVLATALGVVAIGFGIPNHEFGLGNTLIVAGTIGVVGGMILFGLSAAVRQLRRIADTIGQRPVAVPRRQPAGEPVEAAARQAGGSRIPYPPRPDAREARASEMRLASVAEAPEGPPERLRPNVLGAARGLGARGEPPSIIAEPEAVPLAPNRPAARAAPTPEPSGQPKPTPADVMSRLSNLAASPRPVARPEPQRAAPPAEPRVAAEPRQRSNMFDNLWPGDLRMTRHSHAEAVARAPRPEIRLEPKIEPRLEPKLEVKPEPKLEIKPEPKPEPPLPRERSETPANVAPVAPRGDQVVSVTPREAAASPAAETRPVAILKSGVIDGMAYTLYTDGSIEAELPQGTMRFASIDDLRSHLEKADRQA